MGIVRELTHLRKIVEREIQITFKHFLFASALTGTEKIKIIFQDETNKLDIRLEKKNIMGVETYKFTLPKNDVPQTNIPVLTKERVTYSLISTNHDLDISILSFKEIFNDLLKLAELEHTAALLSQEIEKTRRRVNALEYVLIPKTQETIKYIETKINEQERGAIITLIKLKKSMA